MPLTKKLANIADAIRAKTGKTGKLSLDQMPQEITGISSGPATPTLQEKSITANGIYSPDNGYDGLGKVTVNVPVPNGYVIPTGTKSITTNGTHSVSGYENAEVNVPNVIPNGYIKPSGTKSITANGTHNVTQYASVSVNVPTEGGDCSGTHVIEVDELPTENIDESAVYLIRKWMLTDIAVYNQDGNKFLASSYFNANLTPYTINTISTKTTDGVLKSDPNNNIYHFYYIEDEEDVLLYVYDEWITLGVETEAEYRGEISDISEASDFGYYTVWGAEDKYYTHRNAEARLTEVYFTLLGIAYPLSGLCTLRYVNTAPLYDEAIPNTIYYVADTGSLYIVDEDGELHTAGLNDSEYDLGYGFFVVDSSIVVEPTVYTVGIWAVIAPEWQEHNHPNSIVKITESGRYDVSDSKYAVVDVPGAAVYGVWKFNCELNNFEIVMPVVPVNFSTVYGGEIKSFTGITRDGGLDGEGYLYYHNTDEETLVYEHGLNMGSRYHDGLSDWIVAGSHIIDFGQDAQLVSTEFKNWLVQNATLLYETPKVTTITFTVDGTECYAEDGMTWREWLATGYNTIRAYIHYDGRVYLGGNSAVEGQLVGYLNVNLDETISAGSYTTTAE